VFITQKQNASFAFLNPLRLLTCSVKAQMEIGKLSVFEDFIPPMFLPASFATFDGAVR